MICLGDSPPLSRSPSSNKVRPARALHPKDDSSSDIMSADKFLSKHRTSSTRAILFPTVQDGVKAIKQNDLEVPLPATKPKATHRSCLYVYSKTVDSAFVFRTICECCFHSDLVFHMVSTPVPNFV